MTLPKTATLLTLDGTPIRFHSKHSSVISFAKRNNLIICSHHVSLNYFAVFVHHEGGFFVADGGAAAEPAAGMATAGPFCGL